MLVFVALYLALAVGAPVSGKAQGVLWADIAIEKSFKYEANNQFLGTYKIRVKNQSLWALPPGYMVEVVDTVPMELYVRNVTPSIGGPSGTGAWRCRRTAKWANNIALAPDWSVGSASGSKQLVCRLKINAQIAPGQFFPPLRFEWEGDNEEQNAVAAKLFAPSSSGGMHVVSESNPMNNTATAVPE